MSASLIFDIVPIGSIISWSDGTPRPPDRHREKLSAWKGFNSTGRLIRKQGERVTGQSPMPASFTLHEGDHGANGVIVIRVHRTFSVNSSLRFTVLERPAIGSVKVNPMLRSRDGYYEEDECWAIVAITFPHLFTSFERRCAEATMKDSWPDEWETITGTILQPGESRRKDERAFLAEHADDWLVHSAILSDQHPGYTEVIATKGGRHGHDVERRRFLVPSSEYRMGRFGFVVDPERHAEYGDASSFPGIYGKRVA